MPNYERLLRRILSGQSDANIRFRDLCALLVHLGFTERIRGSHHIFTRDGIMEIINIQPAGSQAKRPHVRQVRGILTKYAGWEWLDV